MNSSNHHLPIVLDFQLTQQSNLCAGDVDDNLAVDVSDILFIVSNWGNYQ
jgi:hypothetical protein